jgi:hypothetical protein
MGERREVDVLSAFSSLRKVPDIHPGLLSVLFSAKVLNFCSHASNGKELKTLRKGAHMLVTKRNTGHELPKVYRPEYQRITIAGIDRTRS